MRTPALLLKFAAKALVNAVGAGIPGIVGEFAVEVLPEVAQDIWDWWGETRSETERQAEVEALAQAPADEVRQAVAAVVDEIAADAAPAVREALESYLGKLPENIREALARPDDPTGTTIPADHPLHDARDLLALLGGGGRLAVPRGVPRSEAKTLPPAPVVRAPDGERAAVGRITLTITEGPHAGERFTFAGHDTFLVGRGSQAHFRLSPQDKFFSRIHFMVEVNPPHCRLLDMGSRNGTYVNGARVEAPLDLHAGDCIKAGHTLLRVAIEASTPTPPPRAVAAPVAAPVTVPAAASKAPLLRDTSSSGARPRPAAPTLRPSAPLTALPGSANSACPGCAGPLATAEAICSACMKQSRRLAQPIDGYQIIRELGRGSMGVVSLAVDQADGRVVALKTITPAMAGSASQVARFLREARILEQLDHPHIVAFRAMGESDGQLYFAMDFIHGTDAAKLLKAEGPLKVGRAVRLICQTLEALAYAHGKGFVHRDIKPANVLVTDEPQGEVARLADFGLARVYQASQLSGLSMTGDVGGTVAFMAPEQITSYRESKPAVDLYASAAALYNLLTGKLVFDLPNNRQQRLLMILQEEPVPIRKRRAGLPVDLADIIHKALAKQPKDRFRNVQEFRKALVPFRKA